ncbi:TIGR04222 domain-containing membrane protein [Microbispora sp. GKU 823]|uniref:TIGR04222 domain-containing membrane protein n=1 Tax=Microbispora sp. GKU 823 TaxID=1652100 RepID=UPI0009A301AF|nr:TIGR04222 domain-containing membrane protein [Microbispora sp. GKU 823]OPG11633.1 hypothetical protein B1L11_18795 [Microbispora sp. GKU 823]
MELVLVVAAAIIAALVVTTALAVPRERRRAKSVFGASGLDLDAYELAFLAGGPARAVNTALASLAVREQVRVARGGRVTAIADAPTTSADPVEQAVLDLVTRPGGASAAEIRRRAGDGSAVAELRRRLIAQGHLLPDGFLEGARRLNARLRALAVLALAAAAVTLVLIVFTGTLASDAASWAAFAIAAISGGCALIASVTYAASLRDQLSHAGEEALRQARERQPRGVLAHGTAGALGAGGRGESRRGHGDRPVRPGRARRSAPRGPDRGGGRHRPPLLRQRRRVLGRRPLRHGRQRRRRRRGNGLRFERVRLRLERLRKQRLRRWLRRRVRRWLRAGSGGGCRPAGVAGSTRGTPRVPLRAPLRVAGRGPVSVSGSAGGRKSTSRWSGCPVSGSSK